MEVPVINRIRDFEVGINDPSSFLSRTVAVSGIGKLHQAYGLWKWGALIIAFLAYFTNFISRVKILVFRLRKIDVSSSLSSPTLFDEYESDSDVSMASSDGEEDQIDDDEDEDEDDDLFLGPRRVNKDFRVRRSEYYNLDDNNDNGQVVQNGNFPCSFGDLFTWPDLGGTGSSGVVKLWDHLDMDDEGEDNHRDVLDSFLKKCDFMSSSASSVFLGAEKKGLDVVEVKACDPRVGFRMPALLAEWRQPGCFLGNIVGVYGGDVDKIYVRDDVSGEVAVGDLRRLDGALTEVDGIRR